MNIKKILLNASGVVLLSASLLSCEGYRCATGTVKDKLSNLPLDSVSIAVTSGSATMYTDTAGKFNVCNNFGGCMPCKDIVITLSKAGYKSVTLNNPQAGVIILLEQ